MLHAALERIDKTPCHSCATSPLGATRTDWAPDEFCRTCGAHGLVGYATVEQQGKWGQLCTMLETLILGEEDHVRCTAFRQIMRESYDLGRADGARSAAHLEALEDEVASKVAAALADSQPVQSVDVVGQVSF